MESFVSTVTPIPLTTQSRIKFLPLSARSLLIKCCQAQKVPADPECTLAKLIASHPPLIDFTARVTKLEPALPYFQSYFSEYMGPVSSACILDLCRCLPLGDWEVEAAKNDSWLKEIRCANTVKLTGKIDWEVFFNPKRFNDPILPNVRPNPPMTRLWYANLTRWLRRVKGTTLFPRATYKNVSRATRRNYELDNRINIDGVPIISQKHLLYMKSRKGYMSKGASEMRQKWYPSGAKPRTYFAQGGTHYEPSCFLQDLFTSLVNVSPITNHVTRLQPSRLVAMNDSSSYLIYDLSNFTSNMTEQRFLLEHLATFCMGTEVFVMDAYEGKQSRDLGDILFEYADVCVEFPLVSLERRPSDVRYDDWENYEVPHGSASLLGIFGNLMTCTLGHGMAVSQVTKGEDEINIAGDDGIVVQTGENEDETHLCISTIGDYERTKTFQSREEAAICLKRPIEQTGVTLKLHPNVVPPSIAAAAHFLEDIPDNRYSFHDDLARTNHGITTVGKDLMRFLRSAHRLQFLLSDDELDLCVMYWQKLTKRAFSNPSSLRQGRLNQCGDPFFWPAAPTIESLRINDPLEILLVNRFNGQCTSRVCSVEEPVDLRFLQQGDHFESNNSKLLTFLRTLGYIEGDVQEVSLSGQDAFNAIYRQYFTVRPPVVYDFVVLENVPDKYL